MVGAVTTRPPAAFSSLTASAYRLTQSIAYNGSSAPSSARSFSCNAFARRGTLRPPGRTPSCVQPLRTHSAMTAQIARSPSRTSSRVRQDSSFASMISLIGRPVDAQCPSRSAPVRKGYGTGVESSTNTVSVSYDSSRTKPPPTE